jgi:hypothetical protein
MRKPVAASASPLTTAIETDPKSARPFDNVRR